MSRLRFQHDKLPYQLIFERRAMSIIQSRVQTLPWTKESGGQMFGKVEGWNIIVSEVTVPRSKDVRTRTSFSIDVPLANAEIAERFTRGLQYLGDWHTHPENEPQPSLQDRQNAGRMFRTAGGRAFFVVVIAGRNNTYVGLHNAKALIRLERVQQSRRRRL
jgi:integrative and conjugative element protein (TIGR02256 family)